MARPERPDFIIIGAPKAGTTALHSALAQHPEVFTTSPKEPKYWLCGDSPPPHWVGPGDAHSQQEWIWRRRDYDALFRPAAEHQVRGDSTPFYLWSFPAHRRIAEHLPDAEAGRRSGANRTSGCTGGSSSTCIGTSTASACSSCAIATSSRRRHRPWMRCVASSASPRATSRRSRATTRAPTPSPAGAPRCSAGRSVPAPGSGSSPPRVWRAASVPIVARLSSGEVHRPKLTGEAFNLWRSAESRGSFEQRVGVG